MIHHICLLQFRNFGDTGILVYHNGLEIIYIYIPLGGNRKGNVYFNIFIVFFVTGVWHGASWNFILWGIYHAILNIIDKILKSKKFYNKIPNIIKTIGTYFLVLLGWVLFASNGARAAFRYIKYMFGLASSSFFQYDIAYFVNSYNVFYIMISLFIAFGFNKKISYDEDSKFGKIIECVLPIIILIISIIFLINNAYCPSLYANF